jgi:Domain of unknown function (DUF397)
MEDADLNWRKAAKSGGNGAECVEVGTSTGNVHVRDTTCRERGMLTVTTMAWHAFVTQVTNDEH